MKTELTKFDDMSLEAIEVACQSAFEDCESVFRAIDQKKNQLEIFGRLLTAAKKKVAHGEWENWVTDTFQGRLKMRTAQLWISKAQQIAHLETGETITPRAERIPNRVAVSPAKPAAEPVSNADELADDPKPITEELTNRTASQANRKASESSRAVPMTVKPEIVEEPIVDSGTLDWPATGLEQIRYCCDRYACQEILNVMLECTTEGNAKRVAHMFRKSADKLDPPEKTKSGPPTAQELIDMIPEDWIDIRKDAAARWARSKQARPKAQRIQDADAWQTVLEKMEDHEPNSLLEKVKAAHAGNWKGWNHDSTSKQTGNGRSRQAITDGNW